ncbi:ABC transporter substrate-binding protein [Paenibacillus cymbidii]|uniref:ABC transporter substrate-binding protein n=1 Tax=Paenibacillus cymbidii TaxID=1639034 RepID=UPI00108136B2|nr:ABC transporter substrate-binding protein [Paenibacillus cymbidii]
MRKLGLLAVPVVLSLAVLAGCTTKDSASGTPSPSASSASPQQSPAATTKDSIVYAQSVAITSLDTAGAQPQGYPSGYEAAFAIYNGLVKFDESLGFQPSLAEKWTTSDDGLTWTFTLRQGVTFQDGTPFNADAVVGYYTKMLDKTYNVGSITLWAPIDKIVKDGDYSVKIVTKEPYGGLLNTLAHGSALIPSPAALTKYGKDIGLNPVGTGPYMLDKFQPGTELTLKAYDNYFGGKPLYKQITYKYVGDAAGRIAALKSGQADVIDAVPVEMADDLKSNANIEVINKPGLQVFGVGLNQTNPILQDKAVRQALNYAIQKDAIVKALFKGYATVLTSPLAPNTTGYVKSGEYGYDAAKAKKMLEDAGWKAGADGILQKDGKRMSFKLRTPDGMYPNDVLVAETVQNQLKAIGVEVKIDKVEKSTFWNSIKVPKAKVDYDMALFGYNPSHGNGVIHMDAMFATNPSETENPVQWNFNWYSNKEVDAAIKDANKQTNPDKRNESLGKAEKIVWDESPYIWLYAKNNIVAKKKEIGPVTVLPVVFTLVHQTK